MAEAALDLVEKEQGIDLDVMEAYSLLAQGKRNLLCGEVPNAVNQLQEACRVLASKFGDTADECGEVYFTYGKALLELSRMESGVLGNALQGVEEDEEEKSSTDEKSTADDKSSTEEKTDDRIEKDDLTEGETSQDDDKEGEESGEEGTEEEGEGTEEEEGENKEGGSEKKEEEDVSNLQLAWEMLELSKIIYKRNSNKESKMKLADTFLKLGEVGLETEQYETAISDFKECLKLQKEIMDAEDRALAETYYQLGLACAFNAQYDEAISNYRSASSTIEAKIASLKKVTEKADEESKGKDPANADDPIVKAQKELKDLQDIIPDIMSKIEDVLDEKKSADTVKKMVKENVAADLTEQTTTGFSDSSVKSGAAAPMDISHLVRKKRKPEDDVEDSTKKAKTDSTDKAEVNGSDAAPVVNGSDEAAAVNGSAKVNGVAPEVTAS